MSKTVDVTTIQRWSVMTHDGLDSALLICLNCGQGECLSHVNALLIFCKIRIKSFQLNEAHGWAISQLSQLCCSAKSSRTIWALEGFFARMQFLFFIGGHNDFLQCYFSFFLFDRNSNLEKESCRIKI
jgi:hypothetical protein